MTTLRLLGIFILLLLLAWGAVHLRAALLPPHDDDRPMMMSGARAAAPEAGDERQEQAPCRVHAIRPRLGQLAATATVFGTVVPSADDAHVLAAPAELRVVRILVEVGDCVHIGAPILEAALSPEALALRAEAGSEHAGAQQALVLARERLRLHLGTIQEVQQAEQALALAAARHARWDQVGAGPTFTLAAGWQASVTQVPVHSGQLVAAGEVVAELTGPSLLARLGLEPALSSQVQPGSTVAIGFPRLGPSASMLGTVRNVSAGIDPRTHQLTVLVPLPPGAAALGELVRGELTLPTAAGWLLPRAAVAPTEDGDLLYLVRSGVAVARHVTVIGGSGDQVSVRMDDLVAADLVVTEGVSQLHDGSRVQVDR